MTDDSNSEGLLIHGQLSDVDPDAGESSFQAIASDGSIWFP